MTRLGDGLRRLEEEQKHSARQQGDLRQANLLSQKLKGQDVLCFSNRFQAGELLSARVSSPQLFDARYYNNKVSQKGPLNPFTNCHLRVSCGHLVWTKPGLRWKVTKPMPAFECKSCRQRSQFGSEPRSHAGCVDGAICIMTFLISKMA